MVGVAGMLIVFSGFVIGMFNAVSETSWFCVVCWCVVCTVACVAAISCWRLLVGWVYGWLCLLLLWAVMA